MIPKTEIYFASRKTASAHVYITKGVGKIRVNNIPVEMMEPEAAREVILMPLEIIGEELRDKVNISVRVKGGGLQLKNTQNSLKQVLGAKTKTENIMGDFIAKMILRKLISQNMVAVVLITVVVPIMLLQMAVFVL